MGNEIERNDVMQTDPVNNFTPVYELLPAINSKLISNTAIWVMKLNGMMSCRQNQSTISQLFMTSYQQKVKVKVKTKRSIWTMEVNDEVEGKNFYQLVPYTDSDSEHIPSPT